MAALRRYDTVPSLSGAESGISGHLAFLLARVDELIKSEVYMVTSRLYHDLLRVDDLSFLCRSMDDCSLNVVTCARSFSPTRECIVTATLVEMRLSIPDEMAVLKLVSDFCDCIIDAGINGMIGLGRVSRTYASRVACCAKSTW